MNSRKPTPQDIADFMTEDEHGLPFIAIQQSGTMDDVYNAGPEFDQGAGPAEDEDEHGTCMRQCAASRCAHYHEGLCSLPAIDINEHGGCVQYEAMADDGSHGDDSRYAEETSDATGNMPIQQTNLSGTGRHWEAGKWDPKGGGA